MNFIIAGCVLLLLVLEITSGLILDTDTTSCMDSESMDCPTVNLTLNVCANPVMAMQMCRKFCGNCNITDGQWSAWTSWSNCDVTCANGTHVRTRTCTDPPPSKPFGKDCVGSGREVQPCHNTIQCPIHGEWGQWSVWYSCSQTCGMGMQRRDRHCDSPYPSLNGDHCFGDTLTYRICSERACADGGWSPWGQWSTCSVMCGDGFRTRDRLCDSPAPSMLGKQCSGDQQMVSHCSNGLCRDPVVVFRAKGIADTAPTTNQILVFPKRMVNDGHGYDNRTGYFTAPIAGLYHFTVQLCVNRGHYMYTDMVVGNVIIKSQSFHADGTDNLCYSTDIGITMTKGMNACVKCSYGSSSDARIVEDRFRTNMFSGYLIYILR